MNVFEREVSMYYSGDHSVSRMYNVTSYSRNEKNSLAGGVVGTADNLRVDSDGKGCRYS